MADTDVPYYGGSCIRCDFRCEEPTPFAVHMAIVRHKCERKYPALSPSAPDYADQLEQRGIPPRHAA